MGGGTIQLATFGIEDLYLTNNPQITFFKTVYRQYTNFSIQSIESTFFDKPGFGDIGQLKINKVGDLLTKMYLLIKIGAVNVTDKTKFAWVRKLGHAIIRMVEIVIGGIKIDRQYGVWLDIWNELSRKTNNDRGYAVMIGDVDILTEYNNKNKPEYILHIPLQFWFNRIVGLALPLIALQYHDVYLNIHLEEKEKLIITSQNFGNYNRIKINEVGILADYIYLDIDERKRFAQLTHEYLIEQVQFTGVDTVNTNINELTKLKLTFTNPTKELIWVLRNSKYITNKRFLYYTNNDNWNLIHPTKKLLYESMLLVDCDTSEHFNFLVEDFTPGVKNKTSKNGNIIVINDSHSKVLLLNTNSLIFNGYSITDKISAIVLVTEHNKIIITDILVELSQEDISIPIEYMEDTRFYSDDVYINQPTNYGNFINSTGNPLNSAVIEYNGLNRIEPRQCNFFGVLQPYIYHSGCSVDGINLYSFAFNPEWHQPTGISNLSEIEDVILKLWFRNNCNNNNDNDNELFIFAFSYNVIRINHGFIGIVD